MEGWKETKPVRECWYGSHSMAGPISDHLPPPNIMYQCTNILGRNHDPGAVADGRRTVSGAWLAWLLRGVKIVSIGW